jgi:hypothetical protein
MGIAGRLLASVLAFLLHAVLPFITIQPRFLLHAVLPFITIQPRLDLEATSAFLLERNHFIETAAATAHGRVIPDRTSAKSGRRDTAVLA